MYALLSVWFVFFCQTGVSLNTIQEESSEQCTQGMMGRDNVEDIGTDQPPDAPSK